MVVVVPGLTGKRPLRPEVPRESILRRVRARYPLTLTFTNTFVGAELGANDQLCFVVPPSAAHLEELEQFATSLDGVVALEAAVLVRLRSFPGWFDRHLATISRAATGARPPRAPVGPRSA